MKLAGTATILFFLAAVPAAGATSLSTRLSEWRAETGVTPIEKVITLLEDLKTSTEDEGKEEATTYDKFACFCKDTTSTKSDAITEGQDTIDASSATIEEQTALKVEKERELAEFKKMIETLKVEIADAEAQRAKEKAEYDAVIADLEKAISSLEGAIKALEGSKSVDLVQLRKTVRKSVALADALDLSPKQRRAIDAFLQTEQDPDVPESDYEFHSQGIIDLLNELLKDFSATKDEKIAEEEKAQAAHDALMEKKRAALKTAEEGKESAEEAIEECEAEISEATDTLIDAEAALKDDQLYLKDLTERCESKAKEWDQRSAMRADELTAITKALEVIKGGAQGVESARAMLQQSVDVSAPAMIEDVAGVGDVMEDDVGDLGLSFLQRKAPTPRSRVAALLAEHTQTVDSSALALDAKRQRAIALIAREGNRLGSAVLQSLALKLGPDPFKKVKTLIQQLIQRLLSEAADEATHKGFCDTELGKARTTRDFQLEKTQKLSAKLEKLEVAKEKLEEQITTLTGELKDVNAALEESTDMRGKEKEENGMSIKDAKEGLAAITEAIGILKDFYKGAAKAKVLLQASPIDEEGEAPGAGFSGANKGNQAAATGIIGMLEVIKSDFERAVRKTDAAETESQRGFVLFDRSSKGSISSKETGKAQAEADLKFTISETAQAMQDLGDAQKLLDDSLKEVEELKPTCIDTGMSYAERVAAREKEIEALKKAVCILDPEGVEEDC